LDSFSKQVREKFLADKSLVKNCSCLLSVQDDDEENFVDLIKIYAEDIEVDEKVQRVNFWFGSNRLKSPLRNM